MIKKSSIISDNTIPPHDTIIRKKNIFAYNNIFNRRFLEGYVTISDLFIPCLLKSNDKVDGCYRPIVRLYGTTGSANVNLF
ncbi:hypothetical protein V1477_021140 [Vespula maculifrons]|uniref:Uncharacterized protein n=1 Tax=Vespula maculifrons TaxID=7453 RepID=A0ABD2AH97_VESMC